MEQDINYYYVYEFGPNKHVRIHEGNCGHCNGGKGRKPTQHPDSKWYGPYRTLAAAQAFAKTLKRKNTNACGVCLPGRKF